MFGRSKASDEERYCSNCRAELPPKATECPACGVYAGDVFDGRIGKRSWRWLILLVVLLVTIAGAFFTWSRPSVVRQIVNEVERRIGTQVVHRATKPQPPQRPVHVVRDRPGGARRAKGAAITEPEAILYLRRHLTATKAISDQCIAIRSDGSEESDYVLTALDRCTSTRLGRWRVDGQTHAVTPATLR